MTQPQMRNQGNLRKRGRVAERFGIRGNPEEGSIGNAGGLKSRGNPEVRPQAQPEEMSIRGDPVTRHWQNRKVQSRETWRHTSRCRKTQDSGQLGAWSSAIPEVGEAGATRRLRHRHRRKMRNSGQPGDPSPAKPEDAQRGATREMHRKAAQVEQRVGATRDEPVCTAEG